MTRVCAVAGFGAPNYGDLLYAFVVNGLLRSRCDLEFFALPSKLATPVVPIRSIGALYQEEPQAVLVGGGDILRHDWRTVAEDHVGRRGSGPLSRKARRFRVERYLRRELSFSAPGPFVIDPSAFRFPPRVAYVSCSVPGPIEASIAPSFAAALNASSFLAVRDDRSCQLLLDAGVRPELPTVAPDAVLALADLIPARSMESRGAELLQSAGVASDESPIVFHLTPWLLSDEPGVRRLLADLSSAGHRVIGLPMGAYVDEHRFLQRMLRGVPGAVVLPVLDVEGIAAVIASSSCAVVSSFHAGITAGVYGRAVAFVPGAGRKAEGLMAAVGADPSRHIATSWDSAILRAPVSFDADAVGRAALAAGLAVTNAFDALAAPL